MCVCIILAELELDKETIVAGMLHDVVEDTVMTSEEIAAEFGDEVALLVDGVTKLTQLNYVADKVEVQAENLRRMFLAMAKDIRVILPQSLQEKSSKAEYTNGGAGRLRHSYIHAYS